jgi:hypothetical protein
MSLAAVYFYSKTKVAPNGCWEWQLFRDKDGYGRLKVKQRMKRAHRVSFELSVGSTKNLSVLHRCDNPPCVNPDHLFLGSMKDNMQDKLKKGRLKNQNTLKVFCKRGHEFDKFRLRNGKITRECKQCERMRIR